MQFINDVLEQLHQPSSSFVLKLIMALGVLIVGWLVALLIAFVIKKALQKTSLDNRLVAWLTGKEESDEGIRAEMWISRIIYYILMLFVLAAFFQVLHLTTITGPINRLLTRLFEYAPQLLGATIILLIAWLLGSVLRLIVQKILTLKGVDDKLAIESKDGEKKSIPLSKSLGDAVFWFTFLFFLPSILSTLGMEGLVAPVQSMLAEILNMLPNILSAAIILLVGWFIARILRQIVTSLLTAAGADTFGSRVGLGASLGKRSFSQVIGSIVYLLVFIPAIIQALNTLKIEAISKPATQVLSTLLNAVPLILGGTVVLIIAYIIGKLVSQLITNLLTGLGFNRLLVHLRLGSEPKEGQKTPSEIAGYLVLVAIMLFATVEAAELLGFTVVASLAGKFITFGSKIILAMVIFALGVYLANLAKTVIVGAGGTRAILGGQLARVAIIILVSAMALREMGIANEIVNLAFGLLLGTVAVAVALAFGLGCRDLAAGQVETWIKSLKSKE